ncbi:MAG: DUF3575 domain-containing protein [Prevotella sp.]|nr:DUF3575 domain-containing protein [Prevotella sp.]
MKEKIRHNLFGRLLAIALLLSPALSLVAEAQSPECDSVPQGRIALRTNLLYDATLSPNLGVEVRVDSAWTVGLLAGINAWDVDKAKNRKWRHMLFSLRARKYRKNLFEKGYYEGDLIYSHFNVGNVKFPFGLYKSVRDRRLQGDLIALGGKYGHSWILARDWRIEAEAGIAVGYAWFKEYDCPHCGTFLGKDCRIFLLPQLGINIVYIIN